MKLALALALVPFLSPMANGLALTKPAPTAPIEGYTIWEPEWEVEVTPGTKVSVRGTVEQVRAHLSKINSNWEAEAKAKREAAAGADVGLSKRTDFNTDGWANCGGR